MSTTTLDDFMALNDQLAALHRAGVPLDVALGRDTGDVATALARINATVARRVSQGDSLSTALESDERVIPLVYRCLMQVGLHSGDWANTLNGHARSAQLADRSRHAILAGFLYPLVVCGLVYVGLIGFCLYVVPTLDNLYGSLRLQPEVGLRAVRWLRDTMTYWVAIPPVCVLLAVAWQWRKRAARARGGWSETRDWARPLGLSQTLQIERCAEFADTLANLVDSELPLARALRLAGGACGDPGLQAAAGELAGSLENGRMLADDSVAARAFPPFLRWALWHGPDTMGNSRALRLSASVYRETADRRGERLRVVVPLVACAVLGGSAVLLYGLALFVPVVQLLRQLAS